MVKDSPAVLHQKNICSRDEIPPSAIILVLDMQFLQPSIQNKQPSVGALIFQSIFRAIPLPNGHSFPAACRNFSVFHLGEAYLMSSKVYDSNEFCNWLTSLLSQVIKMSLKFSFHQFLAKQSLHKQFLSIVKLYKVRNFEVLKKKKRNTDWLDFGVAREVKRFAGKV